MARFLAATREAGGSVVIARAEAVEFVSPIRVGEVLELVAHVTRIGRSSMSLEVEGQARSIGGAQARNALRGRFEMVAVDAQGQPQAIVQSH